jgi:hypothetical protein
MASNNLDALTKEYIQVVNDMTTGMLKINELSNRARELEKLIEECNKSNIPKEIVQTQKIVPKSKEPVEESDSDDSLSDDEESIEFVKNLSDDDAKPEPKKETATRGGRGGRGGRGRGRGRGRGGGSGGNVV